MTVATPALHTQLLADLDVRSRADGTVHTIRGSKGTVAELCVGKSRTRLNLRAAPTVKLPKGIVLDGRSKSWQGGGLSVTADNVAAARALLVAVIGGKPSAKPSKPAARPTASSVVAADKAAQTAAKRVNTAA